MEVDFFASIELTYSGLIICTIDQLIDQEEIKVELRPSIKGYYFIRNQNSFILMPEALYIGFTRAQLISSAKESLESLSIEHAIHETDEGVQVRVKI